MRRKRIIGAVLIGLILSVGIFFLLPKEEEAIETKLETEDKESPSSKRKVPLSELPGSKGNYKIDIQQAEDLRFQITAEIEVINESKSVWEDIGFYFIPNAMNHGNTNYKMSLPGEAEIKSITGETGNELSYTLEDTVLHVTPDKKLDPGESTTLTVKYMLKPPNKGQRLAQVDNNFYLALWYPMLGRYTDKWDLQHYHHIGEFYDTGFGDYDITYSLAKEYLVASSGEDKEIKPVKQGRVIAKDIKDFYIAFMDPSEWISETTMANDTEMRYFYPYDDPHSLHNIVVSGKKAFQFFEEHIGDNPTKELDILVNNNGMEYPNIVEISNRNGQHENVLVHEIAHQWFYYMVSNDTYEESWLDESLTTLLEATYITMRYNGSSLGEQVGFRSADIFAERIPQQRFANIPVTQFAMEHGPVLYGKIPVILRDFFKEQGGHEKTIDFLSAYFNEFKYQYVDTEAFVEFFNEYHGEDHSAFFKEWLILE